MGRTSVSNYAAGVKRSVSHAEIYQALVGVMIKLPAIYGTPGCS